MNKRYIIQARISSTRLPGKILQKIGGKPLIQHIIDRLLFSGALHEEICFALADEGNRDLYDFFDHQKIPWIAGDTHDVLSRYLLASDDMQPQDLIIRLTGDNPFIDYLCLNDNLSIFEKKSNVDLSYPYKLPLGMGFEIFTRNALVKQLGYQLQPHHKEHVTTFIKENRDIFICHQMDYFYDSPDIRLTIDYPEDLEQARNTYDYFLQNGLPNFCSQDILNLYNQNPEFFLGNRFMKQKKSTEYEKY